MTAYPPAPWHLRGQLFGSVFLVPLAAVPADLPPGCRPVRVGGRAIMAAVWVSYEPGGVLSYRELMSTLLVRHGGRLRASITRIWVDSPASLEGGRALWGIPKGLAAFAFEGVGLAARDDHGPLATSTVRTRLTLPGRWPLRVRIVQTFDGRAKVSRVRATGSLAVTRADFVADPSGALSFLAGRRPGFSFAVRDFQMTFGG